MAQAGLALREVACFLEGVVVGVTAPAAFLEGLDHAGDAFDVVRHEGREEFELLAVLDEELAHHFLAVLRYRKSGLDWSDVQHVLIPGGSEFTQDSLSRIHNASSVEEIQKELGGSKFADGLHDALEQGSLARVEIEARKRLNDFASGFGHMVPLSILPIIDFLLRKDTEVHNLRAVARGKEAGLEDEVIQEMLIV
jgi:hypothetical protein